MPNNSNSAQSSVNERRLRPIYDWLDNGNNKKALQEAEKVLKKQPDFQCCKALMALALLRLGRDTEAEKALDALLKEVPTDDAVLQAMNIAFKELHKPDTICDMWEAASKKDPQNEELLSQTFMAYVRQGLYKKQQQVAMQLYKVQPKNPYYFWAVMSIVLQATSDRSSTTNITVILQLAERMIDKMKKDGKIGQEQETQLYLLVLELQHNFKKALEVIEGPLGAKLEENSPFVDLVPSKKLEYLRRLELWPRVNVLSKNMLHKSPDQWNVYLDYITSVFRLIDAKNLGEGGSEADPGTENGDDDDDGVDRSVEAARKFITSQQQRPGKDRGPHLAELELQCRLLARRDAAAKEGRGMMDLLVDYFERFGSKPCCMTDLKLYVSSLESSERDEFFSRTAECISLTDKGVPSTVADIHKKACWYQLRHFLGLHASLSTEERCRLVEELQRMHEACHPLVKEVPTTEPRPSDMLLVLSAHILWELWSTSRDDKYFWKAVVQLEHARKHSPTNHHILFLLVKFYNQIGAVGVSNAVHSVLELKHVQLDSLGHLACLRILSCFHLTSASEHFSNALKFFTSSYRDTVEHIISAYRYGSFEKIREFIEFRERLSVSLHYNSLSVDRMLLDVVFGGAASPASITHMFSFLELDPEKDDIPWREQTDNRDFKAMVSFDCPEKAVTDELISESFVQEQNYLRLRSLTLRSLVAAVAITEDVTPKSKSASLSNGSSGNDLGASKAEHMTRVVEEMAGKIEEVAASCGDVDLAEDWMNPVQGPHRPKLHVYLTDRLHVWYVQQLRLVVRTQRRAAASAVGQDFQWDDKDLEAMSTVSTTFDAMVREMCQRIGAGEQRMMDRERHLESLYHLIEATNFAAILCGVCHTLLKPFSKSAGGRKSKKRKEISEITAKSLCHFNDLVCSLTANCRAMISATMDWEKCVEVEDQMSIVENQFSKQLNFAEQSLQETAAAATSSISLDSLQRDIADNIRESYQETFVTAREVGKNKIEFFDSLKLAC